MMRSGFWQRLRTSLWVKVLAPLALAGIVTLAGTALIFGQIVAEGDGADLALARWLVLGLAGVTTLSAIGATFIVLQRRVIRPLADIEATLERRIAGDRGARVRRCGAGQIGSLSRAVGGVLAMYDADLANSTVIRNAFPDITMRLRGNGSILDAQINETQSLIANPSRMTGSPLSNHLPAAVVRWFEGVAGGLTEPGDPAEYEFTTSGRVYEARVRSGGDDEIMMVIRDVTHRKQQEAQLVSAERYFRGLLGRFPGAVIELEPDGLVRYASRLPFVNGECERGISNVPFQEIFPESTWPAFERAFEAARESGRGTEFEVIEDHDDGEQCWVSRITPLAGEDPQHQGIVVVITDESVRHQQRLRLRRRIETLESEHWDYEKRTTDLLVQLEEARAERDATDKRLREQERQERKLGERLDYPLDPARDAQTAASGPDVHFHLSTLIDDVTRACSVESGDGALRVRVTIQQSLPQSLVGDAAALREALRALVGQSLAAPDAEAQVTISQEASRPGTASMQFEVRQSAPAMDDQTLRAVKAFLRPSDASPPSPNGVPESIIRARRAVDRLKSQISFDEKAGEGGVYRFSAAFAIDDDAGNGHRWIRGLRTLVIQERGNQTNGVQRALAGFGIIGYVVQNEDELLSALEAAEDAKNPYRLILVDATTPGLDGFAGRVSEQGAPVVLIGSSDERAHANAIQAGYDGFLTNPVHQSELLEIILSMVEPSSTAPDDLEIDAPAVI